jgi:hypothetical protein
MKKITRSILAFAALFTASTAILLAQPTTSAPTPPERTTAKVISFFSDAYTSVANVNFNPNWGQSTKVSTIQVGTDNVLKYATLNYQGTEFASQNALTMNKLHVDVWTSDATSFQITPISSGPKEKLITCTPLVLNQWNSFDIDLSQFTNVVFSDIFQFKVVGNGTVYIDNLYFYDNSTTVDTEAPTAFTATKGAVTSESVELLLNATDNSGAINYLITYGSTTLTVGGVSGTEKAYSVTGLLGNTDYSFSIVAKDATGNTAANSPIVIAAKTAMGVPAAPAPTRAASSVISIFSDSYTSAAPDANYFPGWGQATSASMVQLAEGNAALKYSNLNYQGTQLGLSVNAGSMDKLHIDVYTENETSLQVTPISDTPVQEFLLALTPLNQNTWNSFDIPLSSFTGVDKTDIFQFKFVGSGGKTVYIDNIYFHDGTTAVDRISAEKLIKIYPSADYNTFIVTSETEINQIIVRNLVGQTLKTTQVSGKEKSIDFSAFAAGHYLVSVKLANGLLTTQKIIKL